MSRHILVILLVPLFSFKCITKKIRHNTISVTNKLTIGVYVIPGFDYPDTSLNFITKGGILANDSIYFVQSQRTRKLFYVDLCNRLTWSFRVKTDTLQVFVFAESTIKDNSWETISKEKLYIRRLTFHYNDILKENCSLTIE